jgi:hypothetical protein
MASIDQPCDVSLSAGRATVVVVKSGGLMLLPWRALFAHGLRTREPLTHTRGQGDFGGLSCTAPTRIDALADRMVPHGHQGAHRPHGAPLRPAPPDGPLAPQGATIPVARGDAHQGRDLLPAAGRPRRAVGNQRRREDWAHAGGARAPVVWLPPHGAGPHGCAQVLVQRRATTLSPREVRLAVGLNRARGAAQAILLGGAPGEPRALMALATGRAWVGRDVTTRALPRPPPTSGTSVDHVPVHTFVDALSFKSEDTREWVKEKNRRQAPWSASDPSGCTVLDGCPTLGQDEDPGTPGLLPRQPHQATQHHDATDHRHADEETQGHLGVRHRPLHAGPRRPGRLSPR